jgi:glycosyltransferase involved in cell wall biosynthesis
VRRRLEDGSLGILRDYESEIEHLRVLSITNRGMAGAFNAGLMALPDEVEYVVIIAGDDWLEDTLRRGVPARAHAETQMVCHGDAASHRARRRRLRGPGVLRSEMPCAQPDRRAALGMGDDYAWGCALFRRDVLVEAGRLPSWRRRRLRLGHVDRPAHRGYRLAYTDKTCFYYLYNPGSMNRPARRRREWDAARLEMRRHHRRLTLPGPEFVVTACDVTAVIVTRGDVDLQPILATLPYGETIIWNNAEKRLANPAASAATSRSQRPTKPVIYFQDDDLIFTAHDELMQHYEPDRMT